MLLSVAAMPIASADDEQQALSSWTENLDRGLVAVPTSNGVYLSWRLQEDEDNRFGNGDTNVSFDIYRDNVKIATESDTTNYIDADGTSSSKYNVVKSGESLDTLKNTISYDGNTITVNAAQTGLTVYAAKYTEDGMLEKIQRFDVKQTGTNTFTADFDVDKAFLWDGMQPVEDTESGAALMMSSGGYIDIPLVLPEDETITDSAGNSNTYSFAPTDCSTGDVDGDGEYEIIVKFVSHELDVGNAGYSGTVRFNAYKLDGTRLWENDINLGRNVFSSAHTAQFLVYDFDGDGKAEMTVQTSLGSTDSKGDYVSKVSAQSAINSLTDEENAEADFRETNNGRITTGQEFLTVFDGETGEAIDTINYPTARVSVSCWGKNDGGNRSQRFLADVAYLDGEKPYAVYWRGYYNHDNGRTGIAGVSFDGERLSVDYIFDTRSGQPGYTAGNAVYAGEGNHNLTVADVDNDGKDEVISGAMCMEVDDNNKLNPKWCTFRGHGDALHIGDYDPAHDGYEFFTVHEEGGVEEEGVTLDYGMSVIDAATGEIMFHQSNTKDTGRGMMANVGSGGYYQITGKGTYQCNGGTDFTETNNGMGNNFRVFWDGDLYDELLNGTDITSWNGRTMASVFNASGCVSVNGTKANPSLQADLFGDWREEVVYPTTDGKALRVFTTTTKTDYKIKSLMYDKVYRMGVAAEQTTYNQPPHIGFYLSDDLFYGTLTDIELDTTNAKTTYYVGDEFDKTGLVVTGKYSDAADKALTDYSVSGYDSTKVGEQTITVKYMTISKTFTVNVVAENGITAESAKTAYKVGEEFDKSALSVNLVYANDNEKAVSGYKISGYDSMKAGEQTVTITYTGKQDTYIDTITVNVVSGLTIENGVVTGYSGDDTEIVIPTAVIENGEETAVTQIADGAFSDTSLEKIYIYSDDITLSGDNIFPRGVTIVCFENSTAYNYAIANSINYELIKTGDSVTFDEDFYTQYAGKNMLMQSNSAGTLKDEFITYNTHAGANGAPWYKADTYGFMIASGTDSNYLSVNAGIYDSMNQFNQVYITLNDLKTITENQTVSFDIMFPSNSGSPYVEIQNDAETVIDTISVDTISGLTADTWYRYELAFDNGSYTRTIYDANGTVLSTSALNVTNGNIIVSNIVFKQGFTMQGTNGGVTGIVNIDNLLLN
jgi:rhamnogalacturonan endolyase